MANSSTNIILFITIVIAAMMLSLWYVQSIRPTRLIIGSVSEDVQELQQHIANACGSTTYRARYLPVTQSGFIEINATTLCIYTDAFGSCKATACEVLPTRLDLKDAVLRISKDSSPLTITLDN
jgi:hypothetical protein